MPDQPSKTQYPSPWPLHNASTSLTNTSPTPDRVREARRAREPRPSLRCQRSLASATALTRNGVGLGSPHQDWSPSGVRGDHHNGQAERAYRVQDHQRQSTEGPLGPPGADTDRRRRDETGLHDRLRLSDTRASRTGRQGACIRDQRGVPNLTDWCCSSRRDELLLYYRLSAAEERTQRCCVFAAGYLLALCCKWFPPMMDKAVRA